MKIKCPCCRDTLHDFDHTKSGIAVPTVHITDCKCGRRIQTRFLHGTWKHECRPIAVGEEHLGIAGEKADPRIITVHDTLTTKRKLRRLHKIRTLTECAGGM